MSQSISNPKTNYRDYSPERRWGSVLELLLIVAGVIVIIFWAIGGFSNRDPLWFTSGFDERPTSIIIYHYGETRELFPSSSGYEDLVAALNASIAQNTGYVEGLQPREDSLDSYTLRGYALELRYASPVQVHTRNYFPKAPRLLVAIDGSYNYVKAPILFRGGAEKWLPNGLVLKDVSDITAVVEQVLANQ
jgi:hypothetical protein